MSELRGKISKILKEHAIEWGDGATVVGTPQRKDHETRHIRRKHNR